MTALDTRTLMASGRMFLPTETDPAVLLWQQTEGEVQPLELLKVFRVLPEKRVVALARWQGKLVLAKLFFARRRWQQHLQREIDGLEAIVAARIVAKRPPSR